MLTSWPRSLILASCLLMALAACGNRPAANDTARPQTTTTPAADGASPGDLGDCASPAKDPEVTGDGSATLIRSTVTTATALDSWLAQRAESGGPSVTLSSYPDLNITDPSTTLTICVFKTDPRPIPVPDNVKTLANGVRVIVQGPKAYDIDAIGDVDRLSSQLDTLATSK